MSIETMTKLGTTTLGSSQSTVTFSNIPQVYTDLKVVISSRTSRTNDYGDDINITFNGSSTGYSAKSIMGFGSGGTSSLNGTTNAIIRTSTSDDANTSNVFGNFEMYISNYSSGNYKPVSIDTVGENNASTAMMNLTNGLWSNTSPITSISFTPGVGPNFVANSTFTLYGIKNARQSAGNSIKATGGAISFDGTYVVHTFGSSDTFTPTTALVADYLVVAGGGGGGGWGGGGGGAGGYRTSVGTTGGGGSTESRLSFASNITYTVTVGGGGTAGNGSGSTSASLGGNGSNSSISGGSLTTITSTGGGGGGYAGGTAGTGGSGGGAGAAQAAGSNTANQGYAGGTYAAPYAGGGGGASQTATRPTGGNGLISSIDNIARGGGGGGSADNGYVGGTGGLGGGGNGKAYPGTGATAGSINTGGGGGGAWDTVAAAVGGSGVVIIRYKA